VTSLGLNVIHPLHATLTRMNDAENKKLDQLIVMLADLEATFGDRFDKIDDRLSKHDRRLETVADRLPAVEKKISGIDRRLTKDETLAHLFHKLSDMFSTTGRAKHPEHTAE
jgi:hypothetical protein